MTEKKKMIPIKFLIPGATYAGEGRNFDEGVWNGEGFVGQRYKFGGFMEDTELHWDADPRYGTFRPYHVVRYPDTLEGALARLRDRWYDFVNAVREQIPWWQA